MARLFDVISYFHITHVSMHSLLLRVKVLKICRNCFWPSNICLWLTGKERVYVRTLYNNVICVTWFYATLKFIHCKSATISGRGGVNVQRRRSRRTTHNLWCDTPWNMMRTISHLSVREIQPVTWFATIGLIRSSSIIVESTVSQNVIFTWHKCHCEDISTNSSK